MAQRVFAQDPMYPVEFSANEQDKLVQWVSLRLGRPIVPYDLSKSGYRLLSGRVIATEHGAGSLFLYEPRRSASDALRASDGAHRPERDDATGRYVAYLELRVGKKGRGSSLVASNPIDRLHHLANKGCDEMKRAT